MIIIVLIVMFTFVGGLLIGMSIVHPKCPQPSPIIFYNKQRVDSAAVNVFNDDGWGTCPVNGDPRECVVIVDPS